MGDGELKSLLAQARPDFWTELVHHTLATGDFDTLFRLATLRKKALARQLPRPVASAPPFRVAVVGGYSFYPLRELLELHCDVLGAPCALWVGDFDNHFAEIMDEGSALYSFKPEVVVLMPPESRCRPGRLTNSRETQQREAEALVDSLLQLAGRINAQCGAEVILANFPLPARFDLGAFRARTLGSDWSFRKWVNLELGLRAPPCVQICDLEFLGNRLGGLASRDDRGWFETKQPGSPMLQAALSRELAELIAGLRRPAKKVLVLDLDNTLWGGVVADDGLEGIELGDTSPRGEAFKAFQKAIIALKQRGVLLAVASKNDLARAEEVFLKHPEMVLRLDDFVAFKANWEPKSENIRAIAAELNLGLDSLVFADDNPAEIEIVRQFAPAVAPLALGQDPAQYVALLQDSRYFEPRSITAEDGERTRQYQADVQRRELSASVTDMDSYLASLEMEGAISEFTPVDVPRIAQLINKSNQFNLTTRRRSEAEVAALLSRPEFVTFTFRLKDKFGDHGLISVIVAEVRGETLSIDTWLMSCRVLKRQVEDEVLNEIVRLARARNCCQVEGIYLPTPKNGMVCDLYSQLGFVLTKDDPALRRFDLPVKSFEARPSKIRIMRL
jgi:FkbH-like protein